VAERVTVRAASRAEAPLVLEFIRELAVYEHLEHAVTATVADLERTLFGAAPAAFVLFACIGDVPVGFAVYFFNYSTFLARPGLYLEDLYVQPAARGRGVGRALLVHLARIAVEKGCGRFEWAVLDWNSPAIGFYRSLGAEPADDWTIYRLTGASLGNLAAERGASDT